MKTSAMISYAAAMIASTAMAASHPALPLHRQPHLFVTGAPPGSKTLYDQNRDASGNWVSSEPAENGFSGTQAADDFAVPKGHTWIVKEVDLTGIYFNGSGPANYEDVNFYRDSGGLPGNLVASCPNEHGTENDFGSFAIVLSPTCKAKLRGGKTYWVSVQVSMDFANGGEWAWSLSSDTSGNQAAWQNPDGDVCQTWGHIKDCLGLDGDLMFALKGKNRS
ncbi:MAG TPA: choice-of-anchor R domain-containing protein [Rhizomicrobium sp.]|nr:choice-of-anchor R domain-containing protein [Rhizomicrobium sp.]